MNLDFEKCFTKKIFDQKAQLEFQFMKSHF